jgi:hypothetical protein
MHSLGRWIAARPVLAGRSSPDRPSALTFATGLALGLALGVAVGARPPRFELEAASGGLRRTGMLVSRLIGGVRRPHDGNSVALFELSTRWEAAEGVSEYSATSSRVRARPPASAVVPSVEPPERTLAQV